MRDCFILIQVCCYSTCKRKLCSSQIKNSTREKSCTMLLLVSKHHPGFAVSARSCLLPYSESRVILFNSLEALQGLGPLWVWGRSSFLLWTGHTPATAVHPHSVLWHIIVSVTRNKLLWAFFERWSGVLSFKFVCLVF